MATKKQIAANRANARKSTGPRSAEGKAVSSQNALKSGIDAQLLIIRGEDPAALDALTAEFLDEFQPQTPAERELLDQLVEAAWLLRRLRAAEASVWETRFLLFDDFPPNHADSPGAILGNAYIACQQTIDRAIRRRDALSRASTPGRPSIPSPNLLQLVQSKRENLKLGSFLKIRPPNPIRFALFPARQP